MAYHLCDSITTITRTARTNDCPRYRQPLRRQRRCEKDRAELKDQQGRQARISDPILPSMKRRSPIAEDERGAVIAPSENACDGPCLPHPPRRPLESP